MRRATKAFQKEFENILYGRRKKWAEANKELIDEYFQAQDEFIKKVSDDKFKSLSFNEDTPLSRLDMLWQKEEFEEAFSGIVDLRYLSWEDLLEDELEIYYMPEWEDIKDPDYKNQVIENVIDTIVTNAIDKLKEEHGL